jgi:hypothetical protein
MNKAQKTMTGKEAPISDEKVNHFLVYYMLNIDPVIKKECI